MYLVKYFSENAVSIKKKVIISHNQHQQLVLITSQWQVLSKIKFSLNCPTANTQDKSWRPKREEMCHENSDPRTSNTARESKPAESSSENRTTRRRQKACQNPTPEGGHKTRRTLFLPVHLKPRHFKEGS